MNKLVILFGLSLGLAQADEKLTLSSPDIQAGGKLSLKQVANVYGCKGENKSPALAWDHVPAGTKSFALTVYDPDAPTGSGWWHWVVFNIPASTKSLPQGLGNGKTILPAGAIQSRTDMGIPGFGGACPPEGDKPHHYIFSLWALKVDKLPLDSNATAAMVGHAVRANSLSVATLIASYER